ncbi:hypothetical protein ACFE04_000748 [Oxalis oulophora]
MGNCFTSSSSEDNTKPKSTAEIAPFNYIKPSITPKSTTGTINVSLYGPEDCHVTIYLQHALLYKHIPYRFINHETPAIWISNDVLSGTLHEMLAFIETKFVEPKFNKESLYATEPRFFDDIDITTPFIVKVACMQHRGMEYLLANVVRWAEDLKKRGGGKWSSDPSVGSPRMEVKKFEEFYKGLLEVLLEHAQMEEKVIFPLLTKADPGLCKAAHQEHARDLPIMNGIKEVIKSMAVLQIGTPSYKESLSNLVTRLKSLKDHCKEHFEDEEKNLFPLLEAIDQSREQQKRVLAECVDVSTATHSCRLKSILQGLPPQDAMQYLDLIRTCGSQTAQRQSLRGSLRGSECYEPPALEPWTTLLAIEIGYSEAKLRKGGDHL